MQVFQHIANHFLSLHLPVVDSVLLLDILDFRIVSHLKQLVFYENKENCAKFIICEPLRNPQISSESLVRSLQLCAICYAPLSHDRCELHWQKMSDWLKRDVT